MAIAQQSAADTLARLGIKIPGTENVVSTSVAERSPSLGIGMQGPNESPYVDALRDLESREQAPELAQIDAINTRNAEAIRAGFPGGYQEQADYGRQQKELDRAYELQGKIRAGEAAAEYGAREAEARYANEQSDRDFQMAKLDKQLAAARDRDRYGTPSDQMYTRLDQARSAKNSWNPMGLLDRWSGRADTAYTNALRAVIDRRGELQILDAFAKELSQVPGVTLSEKLQNAGGDDLDSIQREYVGAILGLPE